MGVKDGEGMKRNNAFFIKSNNMTVKETHTTKTYTNHINPQELKGLLFIFNI